MLAQIHASGILGMDVQKVEVEVDISSGLPGWQIVGMPEAAVRESKERVTAAIRNSGIQLLSRKVTVNLAPAQWKKSGAFFDLPIALGLLVASEILQPLSVDGYLVVGELSLKGDVLHLPGILPMVMAARERVRSGELRGIIVPMSNMHEARLVPDVPIVGVKTLQQVLHYLESGTLPECDVPEVIQLQTPLPDLADVRGQEFAKRALLIAAAGGHNMLMVSSPGSGKTMLAERLPSLLPPLSIEQSLDTSRIYSVAGKLSPQQSVIVSPPFRAPHHNSSAAAICGGGRLVPMPGEVSLAHNGVLFMDELPEYPRDVLEALREPLESGYIAVNRANQRALFPACFQLIAAMNPCACGYYGHSKVACQCSMPQLLGYRRRVSGPLLDRIDLQVMLQPVTPDALLDGPSDLTSEKLRMEVVRCRKIQAQRFGSGARLNAHIPSQDLDQYCFLDMPSRQLVDRLMTSGKWSARGYHRMLRVARTIADLAGADLLCKEHLAEAIQFRQLDRLQAFG
ncbi:MAG: hypothetical protein COV45_04960 [Deltaproteobacteria bacterium CG11_big_fil_rev_8_21_14_0_20_47_16]|nr:MAG: hypothetical protein COV45_04960 [Deltaproteobacteria bacterium CG11_big_fil_rev_8_21_14_0_20_47_16]